MDFLWHKVSEKEKEEIKKQAKDIIDSFSKKLEKVKEKTSDLVIDRKECEREEVVPEKCENDFKKIMFENAPNKNEECILAEKGRWKK